MFKWYRLRRIKVVKLILFRAYLFYLTGEYLHKLCLKAKRKYIKHDITGNRVCVIQSENWRRLLKTSLNYLIFKARIVSAVSDGFNCGINRRNLFVSFQNSLHWATCSQLNKDGRGRRNACGSKKSLWKHFSFNRRLFVWLVNTSKLSKKKNVVAWIVLRII